ncbi:helix-turn-helix transcriptional regulator [Solirubrobacter phytolaccae]|uniref:Helix-turn-helix transcriptional regulator n=1 Tax=Solirubrobacter phytolaccae TaxID=1404360 RepID=A0A9X3NCP7_9ACTN|nr:helix-turn-helix transcriptional regulator [Solirubrobacter phytolaccae]MDA0183689.1 helix-turn-helix transcriptional regulator [Solirubrobacter phytolaccae]
MTAFPFARAARRIDALAAEQLPAQQLIEGVATELRAAMPVDALVLAATDPDTMLGLGAGVAQDMPHTVCSPFWEYEFEVPDFNKFTDLARGPRQVADLHAATGGRPERSARWRQLRTLMDSDAELRATFNAGGRGWGILHMNRAGASHGFDAAEQDFVATIAPVVGRALRASLVTHPGRDTAGRAPGMAIVDAEHRIVSATPEALSWFEEIESTYRLPDPRLGLDVPCEVSIAAQEARSRGTATRTRVRTHSGVWLLIHASCLHDGQEAAVVIEPAKASEIAPLIVDAYELTPREVDVTRALARGLATTEIAAELHLSRYTVADHLKSVYEKAGVSTRGELVAKMFADHYQEGLNAAIHAAAA